MQCNRSRWDRETAWERSEHCRERYNENLLILRSMAYHEVRLIMAKVLYAFDFELAPESNGWLDQNTYILWEKKPLICRLRTVN